MPLSPQKRTKSCGTFASFLTHLVNKVKGSSRQPFMIRFVTMNITVVTEDLESLISRRMVLDLIENDEEFFESKTHKTMALRACMDLWDHELVGDSKDLKEATRRLIIQKISKLKQGNVLSFPK